MNLPKVRKKPTNKELAGAIIENSRKINECVNFINRVDNILGMYIDYNKNTTKFADFVVDKMKEIQKESKNDTGTNENLDEQDIQKNTDNKKSGTAGVRKKGK